MFLQWLPFLQGLVKRGPLLVPARYFNKYEQIYISYGRKLGILFSQGVAICINEGVLFLKVANPMHSCWCFMASVWNETHRTNWQTARQLCIFVLMNCLVLYFFCCPEPCDEVFGATVDCYCSSGRGFCDVCHRAAVGEQSFFRGVQLKLDPLLVELLEQTWIKWAWLKFAEYRSMCY